MTVNEVMNKYTNCEATLEDTNKVLKELDAKFHLDPSKNTLTIIEIANGYGLLDTGTGSLDKVQCKNGKLIDCDCGDMKAYFLYKGQVYCVLGNKIVNQVF